MAASLLSRDARGTLVGIAAGAISAALFAVAVIYVGTPLFFLAYLSAMPLLAAGLGAGAATGWTASVAGIAGLFFIKPLDLVVSYAVIYALPTVALSALALYRRAGTDQKPVWCSEGNFLTAVTLYPCAVFLAADVATIGHKGGLLALTSEKAFEMIAPLKDHFSIDTFTYMTEAMNQLARFVPALLGCGWILIILLSTVGAQLMLKRRGWNLRPDFALQALTIPGWIIIAVAAMGLAGVLAPMPYNYIGTNISIMLCVPFFFVGLAVVHGLAAATKAKVLLLAVFYVILAVIVWTVLLVTALGVLDQWVNFRRRFAGRK